MEQNRNECIRESFISRLHSPIIRQRLQKNSPLYSNKLGHMRQLKKILSYNYGLTTGTEKYSVSAAARDSKLSKGEASFSARHSDNFFVVVKDIFV